MCTIQASTATGVRCASTPFACTSSTRRNHTVPERQKLGGGASTLRRAQIGLCLLLRTADFRLHIGAGLEVVDRRAELLSAGHLGLQVLEGNADVLCRMERRGAFGHALEPLAGFGCGHVRGNERREPGVLGDTLR